jgi:hypothetical protein
VFGEPAFTGWVPTITGRLSFQSLTRWPFTIEWEHVACEIESSASNQRPTHRDLVVVGHHLRVSNDKPGPALLRASLRMLGLPHRLTLLVPFRDARAPYPPADGFDFFVVARGVSVAGDAGAVCGMVFVLPPGTKKEERQLWVGAFRATLKDLREASGPTALHAFEKLALKLDGEITQASKSNMESFLCVPFALHRNGKCEIFSADVPRVHASGPHWWPSREIDRAGLGYRFIRDLFHEHYHHAIGDDTHTALTAAKSDASWTKNTQRSLYRSIITARRARTNQANSHALGRLAYLSAFQRAFAEEQPPPPARDFSDLKDSLAALAMQTAHAQQSKQIWVTALIALPFAVFGTYLGMLEVFYTSPQPSECTPNCPKPDLNGVRYTRIVFEWLSAHVAVSFAAMVCIAALYLNWVGVLRVRSSTMYREAVRWLLHLLLRGKPRLALFIGLLISSGIVALIAIAVLLGFSAKVSG